MFKIQLIQIPPISKEYLAAEWVRINRAQPVQSIKFNQIST